MFSLNFFSHKTPLHLAIENEQPEIVKLLLENDKVNISIRSIENSTF